MAASSISPSALAKLQDLATWLRDSARMEEIDYNTFRCVDNDRYSKVRPLLNELGYSQIKGHGYSMYRITGKVEIKLAPDYRSLFFPLSIGSEPGDVASNTLQIAGEELAPGNYIHMTSRLLLETYLDCLIVLLPEKVKAEENDM